MTDLIYAKVATVDDACDWTNVIIWRMNAGARARSRSVFVPCPRPVPVPGLKPRTAVKDQKAKTDTAKRRQKPAKPETENSDFSAKKLVAIMKGKTLSCHGVLAAVKKHHPGIKITLRQIQKRIFNLCSSNLVGIEQHNDMPVIHYTLKSVDPRFYILSEKSMRA